MWPLPKAYGHVVAFTEDGKVVADLQDPAGAYPQTTGLTETADRLYVQNLHAQGPGMAAAAIVYRGRIPGGPARGTAKIGQSCPIGTTL